MTAAKLRLAQAAMGQPGTNVGELCAELGVTRQTLYRHVDPRAVTWILVRGATGKCRRRSARHVPTALDEIERIS